MCEVCGVRVREKSRDRCRDEETTAGIVMKGTGAALIGWGLPEELFPYAMPPSPHQTGNAHHVITELSPAEAGSIDGPCLSRVGTCVACETRYLPLRI